jgi:hypothetical protein
VGKAPVRHRGQKPPPGPAGDRYVVEARGASFFCINAKTGGVMGVYSTREQAQKRCDELQAQMWARFAR